MGHRCNISYWFAAYSYLFKPIRSSVLISSTVCGPWSVFTWRACRWLTCGEYQDVKNGSKKRHLIPNNLQELLKKSRSYNTTRNVFWTDVIIFGFWLKCFKYFCRQVLSSRDTTLDLVLCCWNSHQRPSDWSKRTNTSFKFWARALRKFSPFKL